ncbi:P-loop containing nucleoside triphosphate hydrolase protein [Bipolaris maydis]|nr:P-loop containing nucleoside triphosphate hydrolase protein [Bipolaris maydis]
MVHVPTAVMGMTGAGKSSFIEHCTKPPERLSSDGLFSCTSRVSIHTTVIRGRTVHLLDTPGFNDSRQSDGKVLQELAYWLTAAHERDIRLSGIIYLHCITNNRLPGTAVRALDAFKKMCGTEAFKGVVLATTMWDMVSVKDLPKAEKRHEEFYEKIRHDVIEHGGKLVRLSAVEIDALKILHHIVQKNRRLTLRFQRQLVDENRMIYETEAGQTLYEDLNRRYQSLQIMADEAHRQMDEIASTGRREALSELSEATSEIARDIRLVEEDIERTKVAFGGIREKWEKIIERDDQTLLLAAQNLVQQFERGYDYNGDGEKAMTANVHTLAPPFSETSRISSTDTFSSLTPQETVASRLHDLEKELQALSIRIGQRLSRRYTTQSRGATRIGVIGTTLAAGQLIAALACVVM